MKPSCCLFLVLLSAANAQGVPQVFDVISYGAKSDGATNSTAAFLAAWKEACASATPATMKVPNGSYVLTNVQFGGPCKAPVTVQILGTIVAPADYTQVVSLSYWIMFKSINGLWINGGTLDAKGKGYWDCKTANGPCPSSGPTSLTLESVVNGKISGLTSANSLQMHISIHKCTGTTLSGLKITAPGNSPNTDGIHVEASSVTSISSSKIGTGDDCISIGPGTFSTSISNIKCGPGHGISIGSLGRNVNEAGVQDVKVVNCSFSGTTNGVRVKTWANPSNGFVNGVLYSILTMKNVQNPIIIDQKYCPHNINCPTQTSGIRISNVKYENIKGSSSTRVAMTYNCSPSNPCTDIYLSEISLSYTGSGASTAYCENIQGTTLGPASPKSCF